MASIARVLAAFAAVLIVWLLTLFFASDVARWRYGNPDCVPEAGTSAPILATSCVADQQSADGAFGDSFGAVNALFTGLAFAGVLLALHFQAEAARRATKPFVVPRFQRDKAAARIFVRKIPHQAGQVRVAVRMILPLENCSDQAALNVVANLSIHELAPEASVALEVPLVARTEDECVIELVFVGNEVSRLVESLKGGGARASLNVAYDSVDGVKWVSEVQYLLRIFSGRGTDTALLDMVIDGAATIEGVDWGADTTVELEFAAVNGSWAYKEA